MQECASMFCVYDADMLVGADFAKINAVIQAN
jgi:hypothetical protein